MKQQAFYLSIKYRITIGLTTGTAKINRPASMTSGKVNDSSCALRFDSRARSKAIAKTFGQFESNIRSKRNQVCPKKTPKPSSATIGPLRQKQML